MSLKIIKSFFKNNFQRPNFYSGLGFSTDMDKDIDMGMNMEMDVNMKMNMKVDVNQNMKINQLHLF
jgi:hypothetical protein